MTRVLMAAAAASTALSFWGTAASASVTDGVAANVPRFVQQARLVGTSAATQRINLAVHLAFPNPARVDDFLRVVDNPASPEFGHYLTPAQFDAAFAPSVATYRSVENQLRGAGFYIYRTNANRKMIDVVGTVRQIDAYFNTMIENYVSQGHVYYANTMPARIPDSLRGTLAAVSGFNNHDSLHPDLRFSQAPRAFGIPGKRFVLQNSGLNPAPAGQFGPLEIETAYNYPEVVKSAINGNGSSGHATIAIETAFDYLDNDLNDYWTMFNVQRTLTPGMGQAYVHRQIVDCPQCGGMGVPAPYEATETTVDVQQSSSNAPGANVLVYEGTNNLTSTFDDVYEQTVQDPRVDVVTSSWGLCESDEDSNEMFADNDIFKQGAAEGQTAFVASGDSGSTGGCSSVPNGPIFPPSSPYVAGTGGTDLTINANDTWKAEVGDASSGGGVSVFFGLPSYQVGIPGLTITTGRNVPDVALNYLAYTFCYGDVAGSGKCVTPNALIVNGTSLVAPNMAAAYAAFDAYFGRRLGLAQTGLYNGFVHGTYPLSPLKSRCLAWHDILTGSNGLYSAHTGYDDVTGTGSLSMYCYMLQVPHSVKQPL